MFLSRFTYKARNVIIVKTKKRRRRLKYAEFKAYIAALKKDPAAHALKPCYVLYGDDAWLRQSAVAMFRSLVDPDYADFNFLRVSSAEGAAQVVESLEGYPLFDNVRVVLVPDIAEKPSEADRSILERYFVSPNPTSVLVLECDEGAEKSFGFVGVEKVDCNRLTAAEIRPIADEILSAPPARTIQPAALSELVSRTLADMSRIACELQKLKAYCDAEITLADVREMTSAEPDVQIFELSEAVCTGNASRALAVLDALAKDGIRPMTVLGMLYGQYRRMLHAELHKNEPDAAVAALLGVKPGALYHIRRVSGKYSQMKLKRAVDYLADLQFAVLTGKRLEGSAMHEAVLTLLNAV